MNKREERVAVLADTLAAPADARPLTAVLGEWFWDRDLRFPRSGPLAVVALLVSGAALVLELGVHGAGFSIPDALAAREVTIFYNVKALALSLLGSSLAKALIWASVARIVFAIGVSVADMVFYEKLTGRKFDWEAMVNMTIVNLIFLLTLLSTFMNPWIQGALNRYEQLMAHVPTIVHLNGVVAVVLACLIGDFCYYWSHRWSHKIRFFWNLGHVNHHRSRNLTQLTQVVDPQSFLLDVAGGKAFVLLLLPPLTKLFSLDLVNGGWALVVLIAFDIWLDPAHSPVLYHAEMKSRVLRALRYVFVTPGVHFTHHSREQRFNLSDGCNFGARLTIWDRLFGTYAEPPPYIPEAGLFSDTATYCNTPLRFIFHPYLRMYRELRANKLRYWPAIVFGSTSWDPPVAVDMEH
jgi:sterol desaturase/sphingolipid hydroxylase (fatty acid hydroxylase superfamily)